MKFDIRFSYTKLVSPHLDTLLRSVLSLSLVLNTISFSLTSIANAASKTKNSPLITKAVVTSPSLFTKSRTLMDMNGRFLPVAKFNIDATSLPKTQPSKIPGFDKALSDLKNKSVPEDKNAKAKTIDVLHFDILNTELPSLIKQLKSEIDYNKSKVDFNIVLTKKQALYSDSYLTDIAGEVVSHKSNIHKQVISQKVLELMYDQHEAKVSKSIIKRAFVPNPVSRKITKNKQIEYAIASKTNRIFLTLTRLTLTTGLSMYAFAANNAPLEHAFIMGFVIGVLSASLTWFTEPYLKFISHKIKIRLDRQNSQRRSPIYMSEEKAGLGYGLSMFALSEFVFLGLTKAAGLALGTIDKYLLTGSSDLLDLSTKLKVFETGLWAVPIQAPSELTNSVWNHKKNAKYFMNLKTLGDAEEVDRLNEKLQEIEELRLTGILHLKTYKEKYKNLKIKTQSAKDEIGQAKRATRKINILVDKKLEEAWSEYLTTLQEKIKDQKYSHKTEDKIIQNIRLLFTNANTSALNALIISAFSNSLAMYIFGGAGEPLEFVNTFMSQFNIDYIFKTGHAIAIAFGVTTSAVYLQARYGTMEKILIYLQEFPNFFRRIYSYTLKGTLARRKILLNVLELDKIKKSNNEAQTNKSFKPNSCRIFFTL